MMVALVAFSGPLAPWPVGSSPDPGRSAHAVLASGPPTEDRAAGGPTTSTGSGSAPTPLPHPGPIPLGRPTFSGHYYAGTVYSGANGTATDLRATIAVPRDTPDSTDFYYVLVSVWDDAGSYDQVGFTSGSGVWGVAYSTTTPCATSYNFATDAYNLTGGIDYTFDMSISGGAVTFTVSPAGAPAIWTITQTTGGNRFVVSGLYTCGGFSSLDYTDYEEVYTTVAPVPPYSFDFSANQADGSSISAWTAIAGGGAPSPITTVVNGADVRIENEPYSLSVPSTLPVEIATPSQNFTLRVVVAAFRSGTAVTLSEVGTVGPGNGTTFRFVPASGTTPFSSNLTVSVAPTTPSGSTYPVRVVARDMSGVYTRLQLGIEVFGALAAQIPVAYPSTVDVNQSLTISELPAGGARPFVYLWSGLPPGCTGAVSPVSCRPLSSGSFRIGVQVSDSLGFTSTSTSLPIAVSPELFASLAANRSQMDVGQRVGFTLAASGGSGGNQVTWRGGNAACSVVGPMLDCPALSAGSLLVSAVLTDSNGALVTANAPRVTVVPDPIAVLSVDRTTLDLGGTFSVRASVTGGAAPIQLSWYGLPADCNGASLTAVACRTGTAGEFAVSVAALDANGFANLSRAVLVTVNEDPTVALHGSASSLLSGDGFSISATVAGGSGGWHFAWSGLPYECTGRDAASLGCTPTTPGEFTIRLTVSDVTGTNATAVFVLTVAPSLFGLPQTEGLGIVLVAIGIAALGVGLLVRRRRHGRRPSAPPANVRRPAP